MTDRERLERIKQYYSCMNVLEPDLQEDIKWLIKRVEELEEEVEKQKNRKYLKMRQRDDFMKKAQRYKQALEFYADEENYCVRFEDDYEPILQDNGKTARQALESEKHD